MDPESLLKDKIVLTVDDETDVTDTVAEVLDMCLVRKANDYDTARQLLMSYTFDIVILDIMGVNGFELLKTSVKRGFPTVMLTAYALTPEALEKSIREEIYTLDDGVTIYPGHGPTTNVGHEKHNNPFVRMS